MMTTAAALAFGSAFYDNLQRRLSTFNFQLQRVDYEPDDHRVIVEFKRGARMLVLRLELPTGPHAPAPLDLIADTLVCMLLAPPSIRVQVDAPCIEGAQPWVIEVRKDGSGHITGDAGQRVGEPVPQAPSETPLEGKSTRATPTIVSCTLAGPNAADNLRDALQSTKSFAMSHVVIDLVTPRRAWSYFSAAVDGLGTVFFNGWPRGDSYNSYNTVFAFAAETGADWVCLIEDDERVICPDPDALRAFLRTLPDHVRVVLTHTVEVSRVRERLFRLPHTEADRAHDGQPTIVPREIISWTGQHKSKG